MNQYFENAEIAGVKKRTVNIMDTDARLLKVTESKEKDNNFFLDELKKINKNKKG